MYDTVLALYQRALDIDSDDIEANFNLGSLYLQFNRENEAALTAFEKCIAQNDGSEDGDLFRVQFAKSYYNIGLLYDKLGNTEQASKNYGLAIETCNDDP